MAFAAAEWSPVDDVGGRAIRLAPFSSQEKNVVRVSGSDGQRITLLVVPPETAGEAGHDAIMLAARRANSDGPADILAAAGVVLVAARRSKHHASRPRLRTRRPQR
nr:DUF5994 family protein [Kibdelosporangium sp. MJ126-NF4]CEL21055.1 hypothetical protein [Kibdelosporangium sp. MJ126-NF4]CTQ95431.1 hypothetical protein [Kibdelosporangium sp. MJ126-NF4]